MKKLFLISACLLVVSSSFYSCDNGEEEIFEAQQLAEDVVEIPIEDESDIGDKGDQNDGGRN